MLGTDDLTRAQREHGEHGLAAGTVHRARGPADLNVDRSEKSYLHLALRHRGVPARYRPPVRAIASRRGSDKPDESWASRCRVAAVPASLQPRSSPGPHSDVPPRRAGATEGK